MDGSLRGDSSFPAHRCSSSFSAQTASSASSVGSSSRSLSDNNNSLCEFRAPPFGDLRSFIGPPFPRNCLFIVIAVKFLMARRSSSRPPSRQRTPAAVLLGCSRPLRSGSRESHCRSRPTCCRGGSSSQCPEGKRVVRLSLFLSVVDEGDAEVRILEAAVRPADDLAAAVFSIAAVGKREHSPSARGPDSEAGVACIVPQPDAVGRELLAEVRDLSRADLTLPGELGCTEDRNPSRNLPCCRHHETILTRSARTFTHPGTFSCHLSPGWWQPCPINHL